MIVVQRNGKITTAATIPISLCDTCIRQCKYITTCGWAIYIVKCSNYIQKEDE